MDTYGAHKLKAEEAVRATVPDAAIVRTTLLVQGAPPDPTSRWLIEQLRGGETPRLFVDELRCPTAPIDRLTTRRADALLRTRPRPVSAVLAT